MIIGTIYTLYNRRAGFELYFEKILYGIAECYEDISFVVYCNREAYNTLPNQIPRIKKREISYLNNQLAKVLWLEMISSKELSLDNVNKFWIPSGANHFPGKWKIPSVVTIPDLGEYFVKNKYDFKRTFFRKHICVPRSIKRGNYFTTISQTSRKDILNLFNKESQVIYPGPSPRNRLGSFENPTQIIEKETSLKVKPLLLTLGRTDYFGKGLDILLRAYKQFHDNAIEPPILVLVGPKGESHQKLMKDIKLLGLEDCVFYLGRVSDQCIDALYKICEFVIFSTRYEGFGFPVLEAMQHNKPLICSDAGSLPEVTAGAALLFRSGDTADLLAKMTELFGNTALRTRLLGVEATRYNDFNWTTTYKQMHEVFINAI